MAKVSKVFNITRKGEEYTNKDGEIKNQWHNLGELIILDDGNKFIKAFGVTFSLYERELKNKTSQQDEITLEDAPF